MYLQDIISNMARTAQKYLIDRDALDYLLAMLRDGISQGASDKELWEQTREILDADYRKKVDQALAEKAAGRVRRFKNPEEMIRDLGSN